MEVIDNVSKIVRDDLVETIKPHSRISIASVGKAGACRETAEEEV